MSDTWVSHVWIGGEVVAWGEVEGKPFEIRVSDKLAGGIEAAEARADKMIRDAILAALHADMHARGDAA